MQRVPQFALQRLKQMPPAADSHPDADLLTAFAEQSLAAVERTRVLQHLAACGECRDIVALALPETQIVAASTQVSPTGIGWIHWPALRWGALAAGVLAVASVGIIQFSRHNTRATVAVNLAQERLAPAAPDSNQARELPTVRATNEKSELAAPSSKTVVTRKAPSEALSTKPQDLAGYAAGTGAGRGISADHAALPAPAPQYPPAASGPARNLAAAVPHAMKKMDTASETVGVAEAPASSESGTISQNFVAKNQTAVPVPGHASSTNRDVVKAKDPVPGQAFPAAPAPQLASPAPLQTAPQLMLRASPRWTVNASGVLQRSFDGGNTWENVNPALSASSGAGAFAKDSASKSDEARSGKTKENLAGDNLKVPAAPNSAPVFHAVAASGLEVWAGGSRGLLYHTSDGGSRWTQVIPSAASGPLSGDILSIQFSDPQHGQISTSTTELWTTSDAGQTWSRQQ
jgi:hypothetical protein